MHHSNLPQHDTDDQTATQVDSLIAFLTARLTEDQELLSYLDLALKAGIIGLLLYLSFPLRLIFDAWRLRRPPREAPIVGASGVVVGVIGGILLAGATNPYLFAAFGLVAILVMVAWLEKGPERAGGRPPTR